MCRALSKLGYCSRSQARDLIREGRVQVNESVCRDLVRPVNTAKDRIVVDNQDVQKAARVYLALNKPRGLVTTAADEKGRPTVFECLEGGDLPKVFAVGRLDKASEGLLLLTNDSQWAEGIASPHSHLDKKYHVQVDCIPAPEQVLELGKGVEVEGEWLAVKRASLLRTGTRTSWLEIILDEGKNRQIRRLLRALNIEVLRLMRVAIGPLPLGDLAKGAWRHLSSEEVRRLRNASAGRKP